MNSEEIFASYTAWVARGQALGLKGPFAIYNRVDWQFVYPQGGTAAYWNEVAQRGAIFESRA